MLNRTSFFRNSEYYPPYKRLRRLYLALPVIRVTNWSVNPQDHRLLLFGCRSPLLHGLLNRTRFEVQTPSIDALKTSPSCKPIEVLLSPLGVLRAPPDLRPFFALFGFSTIVASKKALYSCPYLTSAPYQSPAPGCNLFPCHRPPYNLAIGPL